MTSNNPPAAVLELNAKQAEFLLSNCDTNITFALNALQDGSMSERGLRKIVGIMEDFKEIRELLVKQGITNDG